VLQAQTSLANAEQNYYTSLANYAEAIMDLNFRKGTLLDYHNVTLAESDWTPEAYRDAVRDAWARAHAIPANHVLRTEPEDIQLPYANPGAGAPGAPTGAPVTPEAVPPAPQAAPPSAAPPAAPPVAPSVAPPAGPGPQTTQPSPGTPTGPELAPAPTTR